MDPRDQIDPEQLDALNRAFTEQLLACLDECARGRHGLFSEPIDEEDEKSWPEAASLRELAVALLQSILALQHRSVTLSATNFSISAPFTARAIPENESWRGRF